MKKKDLQKVVIPLNLGSWFRLLGIMTGYWFKELICRLGLMRYFHEHDAFSLTIIALDAKRTEIWFDLYPDALAPDELKKILCDNKKK